MKHPTRETVKVLLASVLAGSGTGSVRGAPTGEPAGDATAPPSPTAQSLSSGTDHGL